MSGGQRCLGMNVRGDILRGGQPCLRHRLSDTVKQPVRHFLIHYRSVRDNFLLNIIGTSQLLIGCCTYLLFTIVVKTNRISVMKITCGGSYVNVENDIFTVTSTQGIYIWQFVCNQYCKKKLGECSSRCAC